MNYPLAIQKIQEYAGGILDNTIISQLPYHNRKHTESVVFYAVQIADQEKLDERDRFIVETASWMHDLGYSIDRNSHEEKGAELARSYLESIGIPQEDILAIQGCIRATKLPQDPKNHLEEIVCDADLFHFGTTYFPEANKRMRKEYELITNNKMDKEEFRKKTIQLLEKHHFHTEYAKSLLSTQKARNLEELKEKLTKLENKSIPMPPVSSPEPATLSTPGSATVSLPEKHEGKHEGKHGKNKSDRPERGIETMFRVSSSNHQRLSDMADNKAHIMITVNSIILSAVISLLLRKLDDSSYLMIPTFMLLAASLITIIFSILATRPSIPNGLFTKKDIETKKVNLLFFGNFYRMPLTEYKEGMEKMMEDKDYLYGSLIMDGYSQGKVLGKKYQLLRISYNVFMFGLIISVAAFIIASALYGK